jgi:hypothetical protein
MFSPSPPVALVECGGVEHGCGLVGSSAVRSRRYPVSFDTACTPHTHAYVSFGAGARQKDVDTFTAAQPLDGGGTCAISRPIVRGGYFFDLVARQLTFSLS